MPNVFNNRAPRPTKNLCQPDRLSFYFKGDIPAGRGRFHWDTSIHRDTGLKLPTVLVTMTMDCQSQMQCSVG